MFPSDLLRLDTVVLFLMSGEEGSVGAGELAEAMGELGFDTSACNINRELRFMQSRALVTCSGYTLRHGRNRMRVYALTETGRATAAQRRGICARLLHEPPAVRDPDQPARVEGWQ